MKKRLQTNRILFILWLVFAAAVAHSQPLPPQGRYNGHLLDRYSYEERQTSRPGRGVVDKDPNVYVYSEEFAQRFRMPMQWVSSELKGVDAVAFRVRSGYTKCGWGGDPAACSDKGYRCEMDLFFDNNKYPLPWSPRARAAEINRNKNSLWFLGMAGYQEQRGKRDIDINDSTPFIHPQTGRVLRWQESHDGKGSNGDLAVFSYDREIFKAMSMVTLSLSQCYGSPVRELWLGEGYGIYAKELAQDPSLLYHRIVLPVDFQAKIKSTMAPYETNAATFFKQEGEKALQSLKANPVPSVPIVPLR